MESEFPTICNCPMSNGCFLVVFPPSYPFYPVSLVLCPVSCVFCSVSCVPYPLFHVMCPVSSVLCPISLVQYPLSYVSSQHLTFYIDRCCIRSSFPILKRALKTWSGWRQSPTKFVAAYEQKFLSSPCLQNLCVICLKSFILKLKLM